MTTFDDAVLARQLDPVLRELVAFGLVDKQVQGDDAATWVLSEAAQRRLSQLDRPAPDAASMFFVGHRCDRCREHAVTRRVGARYLCASCRTADLDSQPLHNRSAEIG